MVESTHRDAFAEVRAYNAAERRIENWGIERRAQDRQFEAFRDQLFVIRTANQDDGATAAVFHGERQESRRERLLREHREQIEAERRRAVHREAVIVRRRTGERVYCRHCNRLVMTVGRVLPKCERCRKDPGLVTARGTETRSFVPRREAQPNVTPLSAGAQEVQSLVDELPARIVDVLERRYVHKVSDHSAAAELGMTAAVFAGLARNGVQMVALALARDKALRV